MYLSQHRTDTRTGLDSKVFRAAILLADIDISGHQSEHAKRESFVVVVVVELVIIMCVWKMGWGRHCR